MTQVLVVVLGQAGAALQQAIRPGGPLGGSDHLALRRLPCEADAVAGMALPSSFRLAWIFADAAGLDRGVVQACHRRLAPIAPVTIALHQPPGAPERAPSAAGFPGGVILQPYTDASLAPVLSLITGFVAKHAPSVAGVARDNLEK